MSSKTCSTVAIGTSGKVEAGNMELRQDLHIFDLCSLEEKYLQEAATLLVSGFAQEWPNAWPTLETALDEVKELVRDNHICRVAINENGELIGLVGGIPEYDGHAWELHPLVVHPDHQRQGIGSILVKDFEDLVRARGATTVYLGTDDESGMTSLSGINLYQDIYQNLSNIKNLRSHPFEFYQKLGYSIVGVIPDANGPGKPDILMAKCISNRPSPGVQISSYLNSRLRRLG